jgi:hypothetical protein
VTEALGLGIPVLASRRVGAALSLVGAAPGAIALTETDEDALATSIAGLVARLGEHAAAAREAAARVREAYDRRRTAARLAAWGEGATREVASVPR